MGKTSKEITPDGYGTAAVEGLHFDINPRSGCFRFHRHYAYDIISGKANYLYATAGFRRILKSPCASKENRFPKLNLPTVYQRNRKAKLAKINKHLSWLNLP